MIRLFTLVLFSQVALQVTGQFLSHLNATRSDALFTTYAAAPARSEYKNDQGYQFQWNDPASGVEFISKDGPNLGIAFQTENRVIFRLEELFREPVVTTSYSDLVKYYYYPFRGIRVEVTFLVYSSSEAGLQVRILNEGHFAASFTLLPYLYYPSTDSLADIHRQTASDGYSFPLYKKKDGWMTEHHIPLADTLQGWFTQPGPDTPAGWSFAGGCHTNALPAGCPCPALARYLLKQKRPAPFVKGIIGQAVLNLMPQQEHTINLVMKLIANGTDARHESKSMASKSSACWLPGNKIDPEKMVKEDEQAYRLIPKLKFRDRDHEMLYWSAFSLMRQCMMPPQESCHYNYYVFSREPKWGWGYGGQVFHESLSMMAYALMDPAGAMNSQRVYMERQRPDGYINYRTGPFLDETIETNGQSTSSAPWYNFENLEIFNVTRDRAFLREAYQSGKKFYQYNVSRRDTDHDGLCEWGAHAELESVRDARVAVWDQVAWPAEFEGPDLNSMLVMEAKSLSKMADLLGLPTESATFREEAGHRAALINTTLWDPETRFYYNVQKDNHSFTYKSASDLKIKEIIGFLPLWAGVADREKAGFLVKKMTDPAEFWRPYGIPSLTARSSYYCPIGYWNGPVWVQWDYLLYRGLRDYGYVKVAEELSGKVLDNMIYHLKNDHVFWEFYSADDLQAGWNRTYIWAGIAVRFMIDADNQQLNSMEK